MARKYHYISGDTHLEVPTWRWTPRVPEKYRDRAPRTVRLATGGDALLVEGQALRENANDMYGGKGEAWRPTGNNYDNTPGTGSPEERLKCLDLDGMDAEVMFHAVVQEMQHCQRIGLKGISLGVFPSGREFPSAEDDPF